MNIYSTRVHIFWHVCIYFECKSKYTLHRKVQGCMWIKGTLLNLYQDQMFICTIELRIKEGSKIV